MSEGMEFVKVYLVDGCEMAFPVDALEEIENALSPMNSENFLRLHDLDGSLKIFRIDMVAMVSHSTPEYRESWAKNSLKLQHESNRVSAKLSDPLNQL